MKTLPKIRFHFRPQSVNKTSSQTKSVSKSLVTKYKTNVTKFSTSNTWRSSKLSEDEKEGYIENRRVRRLCHLRTRKGDPSSFSWYGIRRGKYTYILAKWVENKIWHFIIYKPAKAVVWKHKFQDKYTNFKGISLRIYMELAEVFQCLTNSKVMKGSALK